MEACITDTPRVHRDDLDFLAGTEIAGIAKSAKALSDPLRLQMLYLLSQREDLCTCEFEELLGLSQSKISYHLNVLLKAGLIARENRGTWSHYSLCSPDLLERVNALGGGGVTKEAFPAQIFTELEAGMQLAKCQQCGCMGGALEAFALELIEIDGREAARLAEKVGGWRAQVKPVRYACLGCDHCYPAEAENAFAEAFPKVEMPDSLACGYQVVQGEWPAVLGEYFVLDSTAPVAVTTLASVSLAEELANLKPEGLAIVGKLETENIGIDKVVKNVVSNPAIHSIIVAGVEPEGHQSGSALLSLAQNGVDENNRITGSTAKRPVLKNVSRAEIDAFREQVRVIDLRNCEDLIEIAGRVDELASHAGAVRELTSEEPGMEFFIQLTQINEPAESELCADSQCACHQEARHDPVTLVAAEAEQAVRLDRAGYFVILPVPERSVINVEYYAYDNSLLHVIEGPEARSLYLSIIDQGWVRELSHAAYLGKELAKAELSLTHGFKYIQDGA
jgi:tetrahydromethanopterin S-methyltransferase subunit A